MCAFVTLNKKDYLLTYVVAAERIRERGQFYAISQGVLDDINMNE